MASSIGVKVANGEFYPIIEENSLVKKKMVLTTAHDNQSSVQIDLYRSTAGVMADAQYIGSLVVENISRKLKGEPSIEMIISSKPNGDIVADAVDIDTGPSGEHHVLTVSLKTLDATSRDLGDPDFDLDANEEPPVSLLDRSPKITKKKKGKAWPFILICLILLLGLLAAWLFFMGGLDFVQSKRQSLTRQSETGVSAPVVTAPAAPVNTAPAEPAKQSAPVNAAPAVAEPAKQSVPVITAPVSQPVARPAAARVRPAAPVASYNVPAVIPREGVNYTIRWGDTLWDISDAFYRDPWQYPRIARHNNISNPNHIISGRTIRVPPRN